MSDGPLVTEIRQWLARTDPAPDAPYYRDTRRYLTALLDAYDALARQLEAELELFKAMERCNHDNFEALRQAQQRIATVEAEIIRLEHKREDIQWQRDVAVDEASKHRAMTSELLADVHVANEKLQAMTAARQEALNDATLTYNRAVQAEARLAEVVAACEKLFGSVEHGWVVAATRPQTTSEKLTLELHLDRNDLCDLLAALAKARA